MEEKDNTMSEFIKNHFNIYHFYILIVSTFIFLDYVAYTNIFHLSIASFIELYLNSIDIISSGFLILFLLVPISIILFTFLYFKSAKLLLLKLKNNSIENHKNYLFNLKEIKITSFIFFSLLIIHTITYLTKEYIISIHYFSIEVIEFINMYVTLIFMLWAVKTIAKFKNFEIDTFRYLLKIFFFFSLFSLITEEIIMGNFYIHEFIVNIFIFFLFLFFTNVIINKNSNKEKNLNLLSLFIRFYFLLTIIAIIMNNYSWDKYIHEYKITNLNLIINTGYISKNHHGINVNSLNYKNDDNNFPKECEVKQFLSIKADKNTTYIPLFEKRKIYFVKKKGVICIYIVEKQDNSYILNEVGYLDDEKQDKNTTKSNK